MGLSQKGFLPKSLANEPIMVEASLEDSSLSVGKKQKSNEYQLGN
jgi:hypothetical protein